MLHLCIFVLIKWWMQLNQATALTGGNCFVTWECGISFLAQFDR